jgi:uncharacterized protein (DUF58 family)
MASTSVTPRLHLPTTGRGGLLQWVERRLRLTPVGLAVVGLIVLGGYVANVTASRALFLLAYGGIATIGMAYVLGRRSLSIETDRSDVARRVREGQPIDVTIMLRAVRRVSTIVVDEVTPESFGTPARLAIPVLPAGETLEHTYRITPRLRGVFELGPLEAEWSDPFGLTRRRVRLLDPISVIVHPRTEGAGDRITSRAWEDPPIRPPISRPWPSGFDFYGMRDYVFGDDPRRIVWRATARTLDEDGDGRYLVWEAEQGITDRVNVLLDTDQQHHSPDRPSTTFETCVRAAASVATHNLDSGFSVTLASNDEPLASFLRGRRSVIRLLDELAAVQPGSTPLLNAVERLFADSDRSVHNVIITPYLDSKTASRLRLLLERGTSMMIVLLVTEDTDPYVIHRAGTLGCSVVEIQPERPMQPAFQHIIGAGRS